MKKLTFSLLILASQPALAAKTTTLPTEFISDDSWKKIAESQLSETYTIVKGDTLWAISKKLFGDPFYWPKIWQINGKNIPNPDLIYPSNVLSFSPGSGTSLPSLQIKDSEIKDSTIAQTDSNDSETDHSVTKVRPKKLRSQEWRDLPPQSWEQIQVKVPKNVDPFGFDLKTRYIFPRTQGIELPWLASSKEIPSLGSILAAKGENNLLSLNDYVYIRRDSDELEVGNTYAVTTDPSIVKASLFSRKGYAYPILGKVTILGQKDDVWIGQMRAVSGNIERRENSLIKLPPRISIPEPRAATQPIRATFLTDRLSQASFSAQHKIAFIDRGTNDGVSVGMVFRAYQHEDPSDNREITDSDVVVLGDVQVLQTSERFSLVLVIRSLHQTIDSGHSVIALTDVSDLKKRTGSIFQDLDTGELQVAPEESEVEKPQDAVSEDELNQLESNEPLSQDDKKSLNQLENHQPGQEPESAPTEGTGEEPLPSEEEPLPSEEAPSSGETSPEESSGESSGEPSEETPSPDSSSEESSDSGSSSMDEPAPSADEGSGEAPF